MRARWFFALAACLWLAALARDAADGWVADTVLPPLALETSVLGEMRPLSFDTAGRITLPEAFCEMFGLTDWVSIVGLGDRFQIWSREAFQAHRAAQRLAAREGLVGLRAQQRAVGLGVNGPGQGA
jgi:hypothetical protein